MFARLSMFLDQHGGKKSGNVASRAALSVPFKRWKPGYVVVSSRSNDAEEWTIKKIDSADGVPAREDCMVSLVNTATEIREVKGSTLQSSYKFHSTGDLPPPAPEEREDTKPIAVAPGGVREFYPRKDGEGTRIIMNDKTTYIVSEDFKTVWARFAAVGAALVRINDTGAIEPGMLQGN